AAGLDDGHAAGSAQAAAASLPRPPIRRGSGGLSNGGDLPSPTSHARRRRGGGSGRQWRLPPPPSTPPWRPPRAALPRADLVLPTTAGGGGDGSGDGLGFGVFWILFFCLPNLFLHAAGICDCMDFRMRLRRSQAKRAIFAEELAHALHQPTA
ncbi:hypothetical protein EE612_042948, partial [Oryza sativa]